MFTKLAQLMCLPSLKAFQRQNIVKYLILTTVIFASNNAYAADESLDNGLLRFGNDAQASINEFGNLRQPFYSREVDSRPSWFQLTYNNYALDSAFGLGGDGTDDWNTNGTIISNLALTGQVIDVSDFTVTSGNKGYGTITTRGTLLIDGSELELTNIYSLGETASFIKVITRITNRSGSAVANVRAWVGTRDDYIAGNDGPTKTRGYINDGVFSTISSLTDFSDAIRITSGSEGVLFYSTSPKVNTIQSGCCNFQNVYNMDPSTSPITATNDGSYGFYVRMSDLAPGESDEFDWYYAAGAIADLDRIIADVAAAASGVTTNEDTPFSFSTDDFKNASGDVVSVIKIASLPDPGKGRLLLTGRPVTAGEEIASSDYANLSYEPVLNFFGSDSFDWQAWAPDTESFGAARTYAIAVQPVDDETVFDISSDLLIEENQTLAASINASDADGVSRYEITGGDDSEAFSLSSITGELAFIDPKDFESPTDADRDGIYLVDVSVTDTANNVTTKSLAVTVTNIEPEAGPWSARSLLNARGELFLGGRFIELGLSSWGDFGSEATKPSDFFGTSARSTIGMSHDPDEFGRGEDIRVDYFLPGSPEERFAVGYSDGTSHYNSNAAVMGAKRMTTVVTDKTAGTKLGATVKSVWSDAMSVKQDISFEEDSAFFRNEVTITNISGASWTSARYMRSFDPDNTKDFGGAFATENEILQTHESGDEMAVVVARTYSDGDPAYRRTDSRMPVFFYSKDTRARVSNFGFSNDNPYQALAFDSAREKGWIQRSDSGITITFEAGELAAGESAKFVYYTSLDARSFDEVIEEIEETEEPGDENPVPDEPIVAADLLKIDGTPVDVIAVGSDYRFTPIVINPDEDALTFTVRNLPSWATFNDTNGEITGSPARINVGTYPGVSITVQDASGNVDALPAFAIIVNSTNRAPVLAGAPSTTVDEGVTYEFTPSLSDADLPLDAHRFTVANLPSWAAFDLATGRVSGTPSAGDAGSYSDITITVEDEAGETSTLAPFTVLVNDVNEAPELVSGDSYIIDEGDSAIGIIEATDADEDTVSFTISGGPDAGLFTIDPSTGEIRFVSAPIFSAPGDEDGDNLYEVTLRADDGNGGVVEQTLQITVLNKPPFAQDDTATTPEDAQVIVPILENDSDWDGDSLRIASVVADTGNAVINGRNIVYTPAANFAGTAHLTYVITDGEANASANVTINVTPVNDSPVAVNDIAVTYKNVPVLISGLANDRDVDGDALFVTNANASEGASVEVSEDSKLRFSPAEDFVGRASVSYTISDGELTSTATVEVVVSLDPNVPVNTAPNAVADSFTLTSWDEASLDVLANDSDAEGDELTLVSASTEVGEVNVSNNMLNFTPLEGQTGFAVITYALIDSYGNTAKSTVEINFSLDESETLPTITVPADLCGELEVNANALYTRVDLGVAEAVDRYGNSLPVSLVNGSPFFPTGVNVAYWKTTDAEGNTAIAPQRVCVKPLVSLRKDQTVIEGETVQVGVYLNGPAEVYPVVVPYTISGSASSSDYEELSGEVVIASGTSASISVTTFEDGMSEEDKTIEITLGGSVNRGPKFTHTITITEGNVAPKLDLSVRQNNQTRMIVSANGGSVTVKADVFDPNVGDTFTFEWETTDAALLNISGQSDEFVFEPGLVTPGIYHVSLKVTDSSPEAGTVMATTYIKVVDSLPVLSSDDSDRDNIPDSIEGLTDTDKDGIPDYLDRISECNVLTEDSSAQNQYLIESDAGICMRRGVLTLDGESGGARVTENDITDSRVVLPADNRGINVGGIFDFIAYGLPDYNQSINIVLPQRSPVPAKAVYRKYSSAGGWVTFTEDENNQLSSTAGEPGFCPPAGSDLWEPGLNQNHWCVQVSIQDGGPNDDDGMQNGSIFDPGYVGIMDTGNRLPTAEDMRVTLPFGTEETYIDVLPNVNDPDGDSLMLTSASVDFGKVTIVDDELLYEPLKGFNGESVIRYGVSDGNGGTVFSTVTVDFAANSAPVPGKVSPVTTKQGESTVAINVIEAVSDADGDALILVGGSALNGTVSTSESGELIYTPNPGFSGEDTVYYIIRDSYGNQIQGSFTVTVEPFIELVSTTKSSGGGSMSVLLLLGMLGVCMIRRGQIRSLQAIPLVLGMVLLQPLFSVNANAAQDSCEDEICSNTSHWNVGVQIGQAKTDISKRDLDAAYAASGLSANSLQVDDSDRSLAVFVGYAFNQYVGVRFGYQDLGDREVVFSGETNYPAAYFDAAEHIYPHSGDGINATLLLSLPLNEKWTVAGKLGVFDWSYDYSTYNNQEAVGTDRAKDTSFTYGVEVSYRITSKFEVLTGFDAMELDDHDVTNLAVGGRYSF